MGMDTWLQEKHCDGIMTEGGFVEEPLARLVKLMEEIIWGHGRVAGEGLCVSG